MAENAITTPTPALSGGNTPPEGTPSLEGLGQTGLAELLTKVNQGDSGEVIPGALDDPKLEQDVGQRGDQKGKSGDLRIPDKFKSEDGSLNQANIVKSYGDLESSHGKVRSQLDAASKELTTLRYDAEDLAIENDELKAELEALKTPEMSVEEQELMTSNPQAYRDKMRAEDRKRNDVIAKKERQEDSRMDMTAARCRTDMPGFKELEESGDMSKMSESRAFNRHPDAIPEMYWALVGRQTQAIANMSRLDGEKAGYEKAKKDMSLHVEVGGRNSAIADIGSITKDKIDSASKEELQSMTTDHGI